MGGRVSAEALAKRARTDPLAFGELYERHRDAVFRYLRARWRNDDVALELSAVTFERAFRAIPRYRPRGGVILAWLFRIARNAAADEARLSRRVTAPGAPPCSLIDMDEEWPILRLMTRNAAWRARAIATLSALVLLAACGTPPTPTPFSLGNGAARHLPKSAPARVNEPTSLVLQTHCGLDQTLIDFAGVLWQPVAVPRGNGGVAPPPLANDPTDRGTITLLPDGSAVYESEAGWTIQLLAVRGHRDLMVCY